MKLGQKKVVKSTFIFTMLDNNQGKIEDFLIKTYNFLLHMQIRSV